MKLMYTVKKTIPSVFPALIYFYILYQTQADQMYWNITVQHTKFNNALRKCCNFSETCLHLWMITMETVTLSTLGCFKIYQVPTSLDNIMVRSTCIHPIQGLNVSIVTNIKFTIVALTNIKHIILLLKCKLRYFVT